MFLRVFTSAVVFKGSLGGGRWVAHIRPERLTESESEPVLLRIWSPGLGATRPDGKPRTPIYDVLKSANAACSSMPSRTFPATGQMGMAPGFGQPPMGPGG